MEELKEEEEVYDPANAEWEGEEEVEVVGDRPPRPPTQNPEDPQPVDPAGLLSPVWMRREFGAAVAESMCTLPWSPAFLAEDPAGLDTPLLKEPAPQIFTLRFVLQRTARRLCAKSGGSWGKHAGARATEWVWVDRAGVHNDPPEDLRLSDVSAWRPWSPPSAPAQTAHYRLIAFRWQQLGLGDLLFRGRAAWFKLDWERLLGEGVYDPNAAHSYEGSVPGATLTRHLATRQAVRSADAPGAALASQLASLTSPTERLRNALAAATGSQMDAAIAV